MARGPSHWVTAKTRQMRQTTWAPPPPAPPRYGCTVAASTIVFASDRLRLRGQVDPLRPIQDGAERGTHLALAPIRGWETVRQSLKMFGRPPRSCRALL
jgi:hypothetical protein